MNPFDRHAYQVLDPIAKADCSGWFAAEPRGYTVHEGPVYGYDLLASGRSGVFRVECEIRADLRAWTDRPFPFPTVSIPCRKERLDGEIDYYWAQNGSRTRAIIFPAAAVFSAPTGAKMTENRGIESFYYVPVASGYQVRLAGCVS